MNLQKKIENPFRPLFFIGIVSAIFAVSLWILFRFEFISFYPRQTHANLMFLGFLWSFVAGFLMTAIPKMTGTEQAHQWEVLTAILLPILQILASLLNHATLTFILSTLQFLFLAMFLIKRFFVYRQLPFEGFIFLPFAFLSFFIGIVLNATSQNFAGVLFIGEAFVLNLICGVGSRLIPAISRIPQALAPDQKSTQKKYLQYFLFALFLNLSFFLHLFGHVREGLFLRALFVFIFSIRYFKLFTKPLSLTFNGWGLKISTGLLTMGYLCAALFPLSQLAFLHLAYIGGFVLMTLMVATRVSLVHNGAGMQHELEAKVVLPSLSMLILAAILRSLVENNPASPMILFSAIFFIFAVLTWYWLIGLKK